MGNISVQVWVFVLSFAIALAAGFLVIPFLRRLGARQTVRDDGPKTHLKKTGTPTMGGVIFLLPVVLVTIRFWNVYPLIRYIFFPTVGFGIIGFADDYIKVVKRSKDGLSPKQKMFWLLFVAAAFSVYAAYYSPAMTDIIVPFKGMDNVFTLHPFLFIPFTIFVMVATTNSVNLTDGVDGLCASVTLVVLVFFTIVAMTWESWDYVKVFSAAAAGGCLGYLAFNIHPARVMMGDIGAFALGGMLSSMAILMGMPWILAIVGFVYVAEAMSDIIQVACFKKTGKRFFKMAPLHHHFELSGWNENKVVLVFTAVTILFCILGLASLRISAF